MMTETEIKTLLRDIDDCLLRERRAGRKRRHQLAERAARAIRCLETREEAMRLNLLSKEQTLSFQVVDATAEAEKWRTLFYLSFAGMFLALLICAAGRFFT